MKEVLLPARKTMKEVKVEKVKNGYIVKFMDYSGEACIFQTFAELMDYLFDYFNEEKKKT